MRTTQLALAALILSGCADPSYRCSFDRIQGTYTTTESRLAADGPYILVRSDDGRELALHKRQLQICREIVVATR